MQAELSSFKLSQLFDEIILIGQDQEKVDYIESTDAIFIDDSFAERERIKKSLGLPVFGPEMIDLLFDGLRDS